MESTPKLVLYKILSEGKKRVAPLLSRLPSAPFAASWPWILLLLGPLPFLFILFQFSIKQQDFKQIEYKIAVLQKKFTLANIQKDKETVFLNNLKQAPSTYLDRHIETLSFLETEKQKLREKQSNPSRLALLEGSNRLRFVEEQIKRTQELQETEEAQEKPVEMNEEDLKKTLALVEGTSIGPYATITPRPQLIISSFDLKKKGVSPYEQVYEVSMKLIKRETAR